MKIVRYREWSVRPHARAFGTTPVLLPRRWLHHGAAGTSSISTARAYVDHHLSKGWAGIGYSWLIAEGVVLEGRGPGRQGAHTHGDNSGSYGICMVGNYSTRLPAARDLNALIWLLEHGVDQGWWRSATLTGGHRDAPGASTRCPGDALHRHIPVINGRDQEDDMDAEQDARLKRVEQTVAELSRLVGDLHTSVGGRSVANDLRRLRVSQRAIGGALDVPVDNNGPDDGTTVIS